MANAISASANAIRIAIILSLHAVQRCPRLTLCCPIKNFPESWTSGMQEALDVCGLVHRQKNGAALSIFRNDNGTRLAQLVNDAAEVIFYFAQTFDLHISNSSPPISSRSPRFLPI